MNLSKRQIEKVGVAYVVEQLYREGLRFAMPDIDDGIDFIVYDHGESVPFRAVPVQLKAFSREEFYSDKKYLRIQGLFIVYLWNVGSGRPVQAFGMPYLEAEKIVDRRGYSRSKGIYAITGGSGPIRDAMRPFKVHNWRQLFFGGGDAEHPALRERAVAERPQRAPQADTFC